MTTREIRRTKFRLKKPWGSRLFTNSVVITLLLPVIVCWPWEFCCFFLTILSFYLGCGWVSTGSPCPQKKTTSKILPQNFIFRINLIFQFVNQFLEMDRSVGSSMAPKKPLVQEGNMFSFFLNRNIFTTCCIYFFQGIWRIKQEQPQLQNLVLFVKVLLYSFCTTILHSNFDLILQFVENGSY